MAERHAMKMLAAAAIAGAGAAAAWWAGAPPAAALLALLACAAAFALAPRARAPAAAAATARADAPPRDPRAGELLDAIDDPLLVVRDRRVTIANRAAKALLGGHIEGADVRLAIRHPAAAERLGEADPAPATTELVGLGDAGRQWEMNVAPLPDASRLVRLADRSRTRAAEQMRVDFVANASHELRTPLATLLGFLETLQDEDAANEPETRGRFLKIMFGEARRMRDLLEDLMSLSRIEAERFTVPRETVDLLPLIDEVRSALQPLILDREVTVENEAGETLVSGDRGQLAQMLNNLVVNALKYGRADAPVRIRLDPAGADLLRVSVIDEGEGIAAEHIPRLTERFYRVDPSRSRSVGGTGLGLAIVKHIVLRHRGRLDIRSRPGEGTEVRVTLPRATEMSQS